MEELRKIILGPETIKQLDEYKKTKQWNKIQSSDGESMYQIFINKLETLGDINKYNEKSSPIIRKEPEPPSQSGGDGETIVDNKIPNYIPSTYVWERIKGYVETQMSYAIEDKLKSDSKTTEAIKEGYNEVCLQLNCDCLDLVSETNENITTHLNEEYHAILDHLCKNIPDNYAAAILQSYILRNTDEFIAYLETVFKEDVNPIETYVLGYFEYSSVPSKIIKNKEIAPVYPELERHNVAPNEYYDKMDNCCNDRKGDQHLDSTGISNFIRMSNIQSENSMIDNVIPAILFTVFNVFKEQFQQCSEKENEEFLSELFNMYSGRSIKFMQQIQMQFKNNGVNDYIERFILTKHSYTSKIISECLKHVSDIKLTIYNNHKINNSKDSGTSISIKKSDIIKHLSYYATFLIHSAAETNANIDNTKKYPFIEHIKTRIPAFKTSADPGNQINIQENIIDEISDKLLIQFNKSLKRVFSVNKPKYSTMNKTRKLNPSLSSNSKPVSTSV